MTPCYNVSEGQKGCVSLSQWDKLIAEILECKPTLRFDDLKKALEKMGYTCKQPSGGSSHYTFRKDGCMPITIPKHSPLNKVYIELVANAVRAFIEEDGKNG